MPANTKIGHGWIVTGAGTLLLVATLAGGYQLGFGSDGRGIDLLAAQAAEPVARKVPTPKPPKRHPLSTLGRASAVAWIGAGHLGR